MKDMGAYLFDVLRRRANIAALASRTILNEDQVSVVHSQRIDRPLNASETYIILRPS